MIGATTLGPALHVGAPQSGEDVASVVRALRLLDHRFGVRWEPRAVLVQRGSYNATGGLVEPIYRGLWELILDDTAFRTAPWRQWTRVCFVSTPVRVAAGLDAMPQDGPYAPLGMWLVEFMRQADKHNQEAARRRARQVERLNEERDARTMAAGDEGTAEAARKQYHLGTKAGGGVSRFHPVRIQIVSR